VTDDAWELLRKRAIMVAFETGRPVHADSEGDLRFADGGHELVDADVGSTRKPIPAAVVRRTWWTRVRRWLGGCS